MSRALHRYNRRQRKKKHLGEFQQLGFHVEAAAPRRPSEAERDDFVDRFLTEAIEANDLVFGGGMNDTFSGFITSEKAHGKVDDRHRELVLAWLRGQPSLENVQVGPLLDAWYGWD